MDVNTFQNIIWDYYRKNKRILPWRKTKNPYHIFVSEVMLQQTQVSHILQKYPELLKVFPTFKLLAQAKLENLLRVWKGIGYNRRALFLKQSAEIVMTTYKGTLPSDPKILETFPGIGHATANSIACYAYNYPAVFIETNIRRIFIHFFFHDKENIHDSEIMPFVEKALDNVNPREWYWALMDYGTMLAKTIPNPNRRSKHYVIQSPFEGSTRQVRGKILEHLLHHKRAKLIQLQDIIQDARVEKVLIELEHEKFVVKKNGVYTIA